MKGNTPLHFAGYYQPSILLTLIENGAQLRLQNKVKFFLFTFMVLEAGFTPLEKFQMSLNYEVNTFERATKLEISIDILTKFERWNDRKELLIYLTRTNFQCFGRGESIDRVVMNGDLLRYLTEYL